MNKSIALMGVVAAVLSLLGTADATVRYVHPDSKLNTIQAGLNSCSTGDTVLVAASTYHENIIWPSTGDIDLIAESGPDSTVIDGGAAASVLRLASGVSATTVIRGFTIRNGSSSCGGGIYCAASDIHIENNNIFNNTAHNLGGGVWVIDPQLTGNTITENFADVAGGGVYCEGASGLVDSNTISTNWSGQGGGVFFYYADIAFCDNVVLANTAANGAGLFCERSNPAIRRNTISSNPSGNDGGGIYCLRSSPTIWGNEILGNSANRYGGGVFGFDMHPNFPLVLNWNNIQGNTNYGVYNGDPSRIVEAEFNWWGHSSGPYHPVTNPAGQGDWVSDYVDYGPWCGQPSVNESETEARIQKQDAELLQNHPNPFNGNTTIRYQLPQTADVSLEVYNVCGQLVKTVVDQRQEPGSHAATWDGKDSIGKRVTSGIYFYRLVASDFTATKKMTVLR